MKLPDFTSFQPFNESRQKMNAALPDQPLKLKEKSRKPAPKAYDNADAPQQQAQRPQAYIPVGPVNVNLKPLKVMLGVVIALLLVNIALFVRYISYSEAYERERTSEMARIVALELQPLLTQSLGVQVKTTVTEVMNAVLEGKRQELQHRIRPEMGFYPVPVMVPEGTPQPDCAQPPCSQEPPVQGAPAPAPLQ